MQFLSLPQVVEEVFGAYSRLGYQKIYQASMRGALGNLDKVGTHYLYREQHIQMLKDHFSKKEEKKRRRKESEKS